MTGASPSDPTPRGRWAPSPSGPLHVGNAAAALAAWLSVRSRGGSFLWRIEDLDPPRTVPGAAEAALADLAWLGLDWDEGPRPDGAGGWTDAGPHAPYRQSLRGDLYRDALARLAATGRLFPCRRSRKDLATLATAPHGPEGLPPYPASFRPADLAPGWFERFRPGEAALRFVVDDRPVSFADLVFGEVTERVGETVGDFVLQRRDGLFAYQLAVVVDDLAMGVTEVVRGADLLPSTARQIQLIEALGGTAPAYAHLPLLVDAAGEKLSKRTGGATLAEQRAAGVAPEALVGRLACALGLLNRPEPCRPAELIPLFDWARIGPELSFTSRESWLPAMPI